MADAILKIGGAVIGYTVGGPLGAVSGYQAGAGLSDAGGYSPEAKARKKLSIPAPAIEPVKAMPTPDDAAVKLAKRRSIAGMQARRGRASTILTADTAISDALGG